MKCTELLERDHRVILRGLDILEEMASRVKRGETVDPKDIESIVRFLKLFEDEHHQAKEESALFPVLTRNAGEQHEKLRLMLFEHDQERSLAEGLENPGIKPAPTSLSSCGPASKQSPMTWPRSTW